MTLKARLRDIRKKIKNKRNFPNEASVSQGIVLPILQELEWDIFDTRVVRPEYPAGRGRVDFALCERSGSPKVFIEVKGLGGETEEAVEQVMQYAFRAGVRIVVLTDGRTWSFYLLEQGGGRGYEMKLVDEIDVSKDSPQESSKVLQHYLEENNVV